MAQRLQDYFGIERIIVTLGERGALIADGKKQQMIDTFPVEAVDTPGAGGSHPAWLLGSRGAFR